jgi:hypothetical protein
MLPSMRTAKSIVSSDRSSRRIRGCAFSTLQLSATVLSVVVLPCDSEHTWFALRSYRPKRRALVAPLGAFFAVAASFSGPAGALKRQ